MQNLFWSLDIGPDSTFNTCQVRSLLYKPIWWFPSFPLPAELPTLRIPALLNLYFLSFPYRLWSLHWINWWSNAQASFVWKPGDSWRHFFDLCDRGYVLADDACHQYWRTVDFVRHLASSLVVFWSLWWHFRHIYWHVYSCCCQCLVVLSLDGSIAIYHCRRCVIKTTVQQRYAHFNCALSKMCSALICWRSLFWWRIHVWVIWKPFSIHFVHVSSVVLPLSE